MPKGEATSPPTCKLCESQHWSYQGHQISMVEARARIIENPVLTRSKVVKPKKKKLTVLERKKEQGRKRALAKIQASTIHD